MRPARRDNRREANDYLMLSSKAAKNNCYIRPRMFCQSDFANNTREWKIVATTWRDVTNILHDFFLFLLKKNKNKNA